MALSATRVYQLSGDQLRLECAERGLQLGGTVRELRCRLVDYLRCSQMEDDKEHSPVQASDSAGTLEGANTAVPPAAGPLQSGNGENQARVLVDLLRQIKPLESERPEEIMRFFVKLEDVYVLGLVDDRTFITRILPLDPTSVLQLLGTCLRGGSNWTECKTRLLEEHFPYFVRERLIRDLIVFNFHEKGMPLRVYIDRVFQAAHFLQYSATEQQIVERLIMNFHPDVLSQEAFLDKPRSRRELYQVIGLVEERFAVQHERERSGLRADGKRGGGGDPTSSRSNVPGKLRNPRPNQVNCWSCGQPGHVKRSCPRGGMGPGNGQRPGGQPDPGAHL